MQHEALQSPDHYTVGWIAALDIERAAAIALLDERHDKPKVGWILNALLVPPTARQIGSENELEVHAGGRRKALQETARQIAKVREQRFRVAQI